MKKLIKNGMLVSDEDVRKCDILIEGEKVAQISESISAEDAEVTDASGCYVLPGAVDIHTHMDLDVGMTRTIDDFYTGTVAAACGGTTTIVDHMAFGPENCSLWHQVREYHRLADQKAVVDYGFHGVIQHVNEDILREMKEIAEMEGISSFKVYLTYDYKLSDSDLMRVLECAKQEDILIAVHCENDGMIRHLREKFLKEGKTEVKYHPLSRPPEAEAEAVNRMLYLAKAAGEAPFYIVHLSSAAGLEEVIRAKRAGQQNFAVETCPQYLLLDDQIYQDPKEGLKAVMAPPLRGPGDRERLWEGLRDGWIQTIATDHCPFTFHTQKQMGAHDFTRCPSGAPGVEERLSLIYSEGAARERITLPQMVEFICTNPAKIAGLYPQKGILRPGSDADLVILDPDAVRILRADHMHGACDYTCYEGMRVSGDIRDVFLRGKKIVSGHTFVGTRGEGRYLKRGKVRFSQPAEHNRNR